MVDNPKDERKNEPKWLFAEDTWALVVGISFVAVAALLSYIIQLGAWKAPPSVSMAGVLLAVVGVVLVATTALRANKQITADTSKKTERQKREEELERDRAKWLTRLVILAGVGMGGILLFAVQYKHWAQGQVASTASVGFIAAGAAWLAGTLLGFLFGIPHAIEGVSKPSKPTRTGEAGTESSPEEEVESRYKSSTSLEQISDWLTKIIVGVGLTQLGKIPIKLDGLAAYIASGMGDGQGNKPLALGICVYFSVCGFLFGYLWARLYMIKAFTEAEVLRRIEEIKTELDFDRDATNLVDRQLDPDRLEVPISTLAGAIRKASRTTKVAIFNKAKEARSAAQSSDEARRRTIGVFRALISLDSNHHYHRNHGELGYVLHDTGLDLKESEEEITKAIDIRDRRGLTGWLYYEFKRALVRIKQDKERPSKPDVKEAVLKDLRKVYGDPKRRKDIEENPQIQEWLADNSLSNNDLEKRKPEV